MEKDSKEDKTRSAMDVEEEEEEPQERVGDLLLQIDGVTLQEIHGQQRTTVLECAECLIVSITPSAEEVEQTGLEDKQLVFVLVGQYKIPLCPRIPIIQTPPNDFVFAVPKLFIGIVLPIDTDPQIIDAFEILLKTYGVLRQKPAPAKASSPPSSVTSRGVAPAMATATTVAQSQPESPLSTRVATGIGKASVFAVQGIRKGTELLTQGLAKGSDKVVEHTDACVKPVEVSQTTKDNISQARQVTKSAVVLTGGLATAMITVTAALGSQIGGAVSNRVSVKTGNDPRIEAVKEVGGAVVGAASTILVETSDAVRALLTATAQSASKVVTHKLGVEAGLAASEGLGIVTDAYAIQNNIKTVGLRAVAKNAAKTAAKTAAEQIFEDEQCGTKELPPDAYPSKTGE